MPEVNFHTKNRFTTLKDAPDTFVGSSGKIVAVGDNEDNLVFVDQNVGNHFSNDDEASAIENELLSTSIKGFNNSFISVTSSGIVVNRHLGGPFWIEYILSRATDTYPFKLTDQRIYKIYGYLLISDAVKSGADWDDFNTNDSSNLMGHTSTRTFTAGHSLTFTKTFGGTLELIYVGDTDGGVAEVVVDGTIKVLVNTYSAQTNHYRQAAIIAVGLEDKEHTIVVTSTGTVIDPSINDQMWINGFRISDPNDTPENNLSKLKDWKPDETILRYTERYGENGRLYIANSDGTTGDQIPNQAGEVSGDVSDGTILWSFIAESSFEAQENKIQAPGSETGYALTALPQSVSQIDSGATHQDIGGNVHGDEISQSVEIYVDGVLFQAGVGFSGQGKTIEVKQKIIGCYKHNADTINVLLTYQRHIFQTDFLEIKLNWEILESFSAGYFYTAMFPFLVYHGETSQRLQFLTLSSPGASYNLVDYEYVEDPEDPNPPVIIYGMQKDYIAVAVGKAFTKAGSGGVPSANDPGLNKLTIALRVTPESVDYFNNSGINCGLALNTNKGTSTGFGSRVAKMYFQWLSGNVLLLAGQKFSASNKYYAFLSSLDN